MKNKAILVVSFGTSHEDTRIKTIESIENKIKETFSDYVIYRAWTSSIIRKILKKRDGLQIDSIEEALQRMKADGICEVLVQPTHVINGFETDELKGIVARYADQFESVSMGAPLLSTQEDNEKVVEILGNIWKDIPENEAVVFMGHGTEHYANTVYAALDYIMKEKGYTNMYMGTVESYPSLDTVKGLLSGKNITKIHLAPFMIVAGDHAKNDMAGDDEDSWKSQFEQQGFAVTCYLNGLGELSEIQNIFIEHVRDAK